MENTVVGVYDSYTQARNAMNELIASGFPRDHVQLNPEQETSVSGADVADSNYKSESGIGHFFRSLFGRGDSDDETHRDIYAEAVRRGSCVLTVSADSDAQRDHAADIMNRYDPVDIDERSAHWRSRGWSGYDTSAPRLTEEEILQERSHYVQKPPSASTANLQNEMGAAGTSRIPVIQEELKVGKRVVQRGGVRVFQHIKETPVHESVQLREEHVRVERHPVDQPVSEADLAAFKEGSIEVREMGEEPVVSKTARVVEEVIVDKEVSEQTANIDDSLRSTDVEVQQFGGAEDDADFRRHWQTAYSTSGGRYEDYDAAYRYGSTLAGTERFKNYRWSEVEPDIRSEWESRHPSGTWEKVKDAIRYGAERVSGSRYH